MMWILRKIILFAAVVGCMAAFAYAQTKKNQRTPADKDVAAPASSDGQIEPSKENSKKKTNQRPVNSQTEKDDVVPTPKGDGTVYRYEFYQPDFVVSRYIITHDDAGNGKIVFYKRGHDEPLDDPVKLTGITLDAIRTTLAEMDFLASTENYQYEKDYSHLGTSRITIERGEQKRTVEYNWTTHKLARQLAAEYRRISNLYLWKFEINISRENQPLEAPKLMERLDQMVGQEQVADPDSLIPFLSELSNDERLPLMARNRAAKIIQKIEKKKK